MTNRTAFLKKHGLPADYSPSMREIAKLADMPVGALRQVYQKGMGAYHTNPESVRVKGTFKKDASAPLSAKLSPQQWSMARVYAFVQKTKKVFYGADRHIAESFSLL
jgi:hypothetical protein